MSRFLIRQQEKFVQALGKHNIPGLRWLLEGFNYYDVSRVKEVGPDRAAAEWIVRCGGSEELCFGFDKIEDTFDDYNALIKRTAELDPRVPNDNVKVTHILAVDASVTGYGCRHFGLFLNDFWYLNDETRIIIPVLTAKTAIRNLKLG
ncbi:unnamed protein product [Heligmosomoides polygyrus]|uniref:ATP synthase subunit s, mitochondrial n=1 Tax=Heligmosomoides polygyrus TaxID=6339 RepID=A0A3P7ZNC4_HELPZ|nr:unnamed protein product [Heligmosomoides polygyrus]